MVWKHKRKQRSYRGNRAINLEDAMVILYEIEDSVGLTEEEQAAIEIAAQALNDIRVALLDGGKMYFD